MDIALEAGVSTATVDRVLNKRHGVRPVTARPPKHALMKGKGSIREHFRPERYD